MFSKIVKVKKSNPIPNRMYPHLKKKITYEKRIDTQYLLILACNGPFLVIKKTKIYEN